VISASQARAVKAEAEKREKAGKKQPCGKFPQGSKTRSIVGAFAGVSGKTFSLQPGFICRVLMVASWFSLVPAP